MYYTKLILEETETMSTDDAYRLAIEKRWEFIDDGNGRSKYMQIGADSTWISNDAYNQDQPQVNQGPDSHSTFLGPSISYFALIKVWNTEAAAQGWVDAVEALQLPGVTISYHGTTDPSI
jgi:hypothetical protein